MRKNKKKPKETEFVGKSELLCKKLSLFPDGSMCLFLDFVSEKTSSFQRETEIFCVDSSAFFLHAPHNSLLLFSLP
jgi:hypothetical protein